MDWRYLELKKINDKIDKLLEVYAKCVNKNAEKEIKMRLTELKREKVILCSKIKDQDYFDF